MSARIRCVAMGDADAAGAGDAGDGSAWWLAEQEPWRVVDRGALVEVAGIGYPWGYWLAIWAALVSVLWLLGRGDGVADWLSGPGPGFVLIAGLMTFLTVRDLTFLRADSAGLYVRTTFLRRTFEFVPWDDVVGLRAARAASFLAAEEWFVVTRARELKLLQLAVVAAPKRPQKLRQIVVGIARVPTRFGRPPLRLDAPAFPPPQRGYRPPPSDPDA